MDSTNIHKKRGKKLTEWPEGQIISQSESQIISQFIMV